jgi:integrase
MRIGEVVSLRRQDVDLNVGQLTIHKAKGGKSRLVPLEESTTKVLTDYTRRRDKLLKHRLGEFFFVSDCGMPLSRNAVENTFRALSLQIGFRGPLDHSGPRIHDLRHTFVVETLLRWYRAGDDVERRLPVLSTYLGHSRVSETYWYMSLCPELMGLTVARYEQWLEGNS